MGEQKLVPKIDYDVPIEEVPLLAIQLTRFPCGSLILGVSLFRALVDGASVGSFMPSWAKLARGESLEDSSLMPVLDRTLLDSRMLRLPPRFQHPEFSPPPLWEGSNYKVTKTMYATAILKLTKHQVEKLKKKTNKGQGQQQQHYTSFEVITGHLWRCVSKVRNNAGGNWNQPTRLTTLVNCRNRLNPPLPKTYFGNATFPTVTQTCSFDEVVHKPLSYVVGKVREAIGKVSDEYVRSALDYVANQKDLNLLRDTFYNNQFRGRGGDPNLYVVGWTNFSFFETDFGWGKPDCLVPGNVNSDGKAFLLDTRIGDGFIVTICLQASHIDALKKLFYEDIEEPTTSKL